MLKELIDIVGEDFVSDQPEELYLYSKDMTENIPQRPQYVVMPDNVKQVQEIVKLANKNKINITPYVAGSNVGGLSIPYGGGITMDLKRMDRVIEINEKDMYIIIEPGFTFGHFRKLLNDELTEYQYSFPFAPPYSSVLVNALLQGLGNLSHKYGSMSEYINGLEVVLPTGELIKAGTGAISPYWYSRTPMPDIIGLFVGWQGTTGIATKGSVCLWPKPPKITHCVVFATDPADVYDKFIFKLSRSGICQEIGGGLLNMFMSKGLLPMDELKDLIDMMGFIPRFEGLYFVNLITLYGNTDEEVKAKYKYLVKMVNDTNDQDNAQLVLLKPEDYGEMGQKMMTPMDLPIQIPGLLNKGGLTWVGSYVPLSRWLDGCIKGIEIHRKYDKIPGVLHRPMKSGHYGVLRFLIPFDKSNNEEIQEIRDMVKELADAILDVGGVVYKMPPWVAPKIMDKADPGFVNLLKRIKKTLDPNGILNPKHLGFD
jgi:glycolate oxidase